MITRHTGGGAVSQVGGSSSTVSRRRLCGSQAYDSRYISFHAVDFAPPIPSLSAVYDQASNTTTTTTSRRCEAGGGGLTVVALCVCVGHDNRRSSTSMAARACSTAATASWGRGPRPSHRPAGCSTTVRAAPASLHPLRTMYVSACLLGWQLTATAMWCCRDWLLAAAQSQCSCPSPGPTARSPTAPTGSTRPASSTGKGEGHY